MHPPHWREIGAEIGAFLLAASCAGCDLPGVFLCEGCRGALTPAPRELRTPAGLRVRAALPFEGVAARCIRSLKGEGTTVLARPLGTALSGALLDELDEGIRASPIPTSRAAFRRRGYRVPDILLARAGVAPWCVLRHAGARADQRGLGRAERAQNVRGSMRARRRGEGARVVLVDDVVTTGATFDEAARVLGQAGFEVVAAVALAATAGHSGLRGDAPTTRSN